MLKLTAYPAKRFWLMPEVGSNMAQWHPFEQVRGLAQQVFIRSDAGFKTGRDKAFFRRI